MVALENSQVRCEELHNEALQDLTTKYVKALMVEIEKYKNIAAMAVTVLQSNPATKKIQLPAIAETVEPEWFVRMTQAAIEKTKPLFADL